MESMIQKMRGLFADCSWDDAGQKDLELQITRILHQIGIPAHIKGYSYLRYAIITAVNDPEAIGMVTKILYPTVARRYGTTAQRVERAMRHAIKVAWDHGEVDILDMFFGYAVPRPRGKPTNSEFIAMIADYLKLKIATYPPSHYPRNDIASDIPHNELPEQSYLRANPVGKG